MTAPSSLPARRPWAATASRSRRPLSRRSTSTTAERPRTKLPGLTYVTYKTTLVAYRRGYRRIPSLRHHAGRPFPGAVHRLDGTLARGLRLLEGARAVALLLANRGGTAR